MNQVLTMSPRRASHKGIKRANVLEGVSSYSALGRLADRAALALLRERSGRSSDKDEAVLKLAADVLAAIRTPGPSREGLTAPYRSLVRLDPIDLVEHWESSHDQERHWGGEELSASLDRILQKDAESNDFESLLTFLSAVSAATLELSEEALRSQRR